MKTNGYIFILLFLIFSLMLSGCEKSGDISRSPVPIPPTYPTSAESDSVMKTDKDFYSVTGYDSLLPSREILLALNSKYTGKILFLDQSGSLIREKTIELKVENLSKWNINGKTRYSYFRTDGVSTLDGITGTELGYIEICDSSLSILQTIKLLPYGRIDTASQDKIDVHEFILLGDNHYICETYYSVKPTNIPADLHPASGAKVAACIIQEIKDGHVIFQWDGSSFPEFYSSSVEGNQFNDTSVTQDYMHLNSICIDSSDNNLILSFRNLNQIIKINRGTGAIMWRLGGKNSDFPLTADQVFLRQHFPRLIENNQTLILLDNGLDSVRPFSRILEFQLDENTKSVSSFRAFTVPDTFIQYAGSVIKEGNNYFIGGGSAKYSLEVNYLTSQKRIRLNLSYPSYRSPKF